MLTCLMAAVVVRLRRVCLVAGVIVGHKSGSGDLTFWVPCEGRLRELGLLSLEQRCLWGAPSSSHYRECGSWCFVRAHGRV